MNPTIAMVFDFDDTLVPDSTTAILKKAKVDVDLFWNERARRLIEDGWDPVHAFLKLFLDLTKQGQPLEGLTNKNLREFGSHLEPYSGLPDFFSDVRKIVKKTEPSATIQFWVVSGGLEEVIRGCKVISKHLDGFWGCRLAGDSPNGPIQYIKRAISFTEKTRYLFEIQKGLKPRETDENPFLVNKDMSEKERPVPFTNMVYVGDGLTDIPCFSFLKGRKGFSYAVMQGKTMSARRRLFADLVVGDRVNSMALPRYGEDHTLGAMLRTTAAEIAGRFKVLRAQALG